MAQNPWIRRYESRGTEFESSCPEIGEPKH
jgi:hypothetical protein